MSDLIITRPVKTKTGRPAKIKDDDLNRLVMMWNMGASMEDLARDFKCHKTTISRALKSLESRQK